MKQSKFLPTFLENTPSEDSSKAVTRETMMVGTDFKGMDEINVAVAYLAEYLRTIVGDAKADQFQQCLAEDLQLRYQAHWHPSQPTRGSAYRHLSCRGRAGCGSMSMDKSVLSAMKSAGIDMSTVDTLFPDDIYLWVDPFEVSVRVGRGPILVISNTSGRWSTTPPRSPNGTVQSWGMGSQEGSSQSSSLQSSPSWTSSGSSSSYSHKPLTPPTAHTNSGNTGLNATAAVYSPPTARSVSGHPQSRTQTISPPTYTNTHPHSNGHRAHRTPHRQASLPAAWANSQFDQPLHHQQMPRGINSNRHHFPMAPHDARMADAQWAY